MCHSSTEEPAGDRSGWQHSRERFESDGCSPDREETVRPYGKKIVPFWEAPFIMKAPALSSFFFPASCPHLDLDPLDVATVDTKLCLGTGWGWGGGPADADALVKPVT